MDVKLILLFSVLLIIAVLQKVEADFYFNHPLPKLEDIGKSQFKCVPGRTVIKIQEKPLQYVHNPLTSSSIEDDDYLRSHMNSKTKDESCRVCVCSVEGKDEYCSNRPAKNVNECIRMASLVQKFNQNAPFDHERSLSWRIRRDYVWHNDEIPYEAHAKCRRGHSYYSNSVQANDTDIDVPSDVESLLDYSNKDVCFYCICSVDGRAASCIPRMPWFCERYRYLREDGTPRDMYATLFQQDRPTYFRQLSYRLRRTMDEGIFELIARNVGGKSKVPIEEKCIPFVSQYSDCSDGATCSDCTLCTCNAQAKWECKPANSCWEVFKYPPLDEASVEQAFTLLENEAEAFGSKKKEKLPDHVVPTPEDDDAVLGNSDNIEDSLSALLRMKRSVDVNTIIDHKKNDSINFYEIVDEVNEDTLKNNKTSGTLLAKKIASDVKISRRTDIFGNNTPNSLQIEHNKHIHHITDNKIDETIHTDPHLDEKIHEVIGNISQKARDKTLSKLIVNELKPGIEIIGDKETPIMSNVTFAPENDTLTAMAYIAGNLLNKLWNMEKDSNTESFESEVLKHEKISDLIDLFKEPLSLRQENFLRNALEQLSSAINKKDVENMTICESLTPMDSAKDTHSEEINSKKKCNNSKTSDKSDNVSQEAVGKIMNVLSLINKFEEVQKKLDNKNKTNVKDNKNLGVSPLELLNQDETASLNTFGGILEKITKLLMPNKRGNKLASKIKYQNIFAHSDDYKKKFKTLYNVDLDDINLSTKDKLVMDYLTHIEKNPDCLLNDKSYKYETKSLPKLEGDILLNLSEFLKIKSYSDLMQLLETEKANKFAVRTSAELIEATTKKPAKLEIKKMKNVADEGKFALAKEKLKNHLKTVLEDLFALQNSTDGINGTNIKMSDALPCIYNLLNADTEIKTRRTGTNPLRSIKPVFDYLKKEVKQPQTRRMNIVTKRPKSAVVWERVVKNLNKKVKATRRNLVIETPKTFHEINNLIKQTDSKGSNTYKNVALIAEVPAADRLVLLQTLNNDVKNYVKILEDMKTSIDFDSQVSTETLKDFIEFTDNVATNINLNKKIIKSIVKPKSKKLIVKDINPTNLTPNNKQSIGFADSKLETVTNNNIRLSRNQIVNHLIKNRMRAYLKAREVDVSDINEDMNYGIAKNVLDYLERGNDALARDLFKVFVSNKQKGSSRIIAPPPLIESRLPSLANKVPLIQFEKPKVIRSRIQPNNDQLLKQFLNMKNM